MSPFTLQQVVHAKKRPPVFSRIAAALLTVFAILLVFVLIFSISTARALMSVPPAGLSNYSSTMMPSFSLVSIRSMDDQNRLTGWLFTPDGISRGTVVMVHDNGGTRLQFGADTLMLYDFFTERGYSVLSFDLRRSGESGGQFATYGYNEWEDVLVAMDYAWRNSTNDNLILYGMGSGCAASLLALDNLPAAAEDRNDFYGDDADVKTERMKDMHITRESVIALILDGHASSLDAYIRADLEDGLLNRLIGQHTVPAAVRFSAQSNRSARLVPVLSRTIKPVFLIGKGPEEESDSSVLLDERTRLHPDSTLVYAPEDSGFLEAFTDDPDAYLDELDAFMTRFPDRVTEP